jgi:hypothetical protein
MIDLKKERNFFETRVIEYQTGGALSWDWLIPCLTSLFKHLQIQFSSAWTHPVHGIGHLSSSMNLLALMKSQVFWTNDLKTWSRSI